MNAIIINKALLAFLSDHILYIVLALLFIGPLVTGYVAWHIKGWQGRIEHELHRLADRVDNLYDRMDRLYALVTASLGKAETKTSSPLTLSDYGETLSQKVDAPTLAARYAEQFKGRVGGLNAYQIQEQCFEFAQGQLLDDLKAHHEDGFNQVTTCAYEEGIETGKIMRVIGILMRDILLQHTGQYHQAVDDHASPTSP